MPVRRAAGKRSRSPSPPFDNPPLWGGGNSRPRRVVLVMMTRLAFAFVLATLLAGCGLAAGAPASSSPAGSPTHPTASADARTLLARPVKLPVVPAGSACPVSPVASRKLDITNPRGSGPFYLGGQMPQGAYAWNKTVWVLVDGAQRPVLFRGRRVDGAGALRFSGSSADPSDQGVTPSGGVSETFYTSVIVHAEADAFYVYPATSGCYALQVDGPSFQEVIVVFAT